ncbi:MAG: HlyC/CorC family transporter [Holdemanella sp.]|nr:HlyC/CorC family transporter [Holdemanella sp.]
MPFIIIPILLLSIYFSMMEAVIRVDRGIEKYTSYSSSVSWVLLLLNVACVNYIIFIVIPFLSNWIKINPFIYILIFILYVYLWMFFIEKLPKKYILSRSKETKKAMLKQFDKINSFLSIFTKPVQIDIRQEQEEILEKDIREMISASSKRGHMEEGQKEYIENIFEFDDTYVEEICTHRSEVISLYQEDDEETWKKTIHENRHTFYPVYGQDEDDVIGILDTRDYFRLDDLSQKNVMEKAVDAPFFVPEIMKLDDLFKDMQLRRQYFAIVVDEYGGMSGIVTLHDIVETILGEMNEGEDEGDKDILRVGEDHFKIYGLASLEDVSEELKIELPVDDYQTFGGYILSCYGKLPDDGTSFDVELDIMSVHVETVENHHVGMTDVKIKKAIEMSEE